MKGAFLYMRLYEGQKVRLRAPEANDLQRAKRWMDEADVNALLGRILDAASRGARRGGEGRDEGAAPRPAQPFETTVVYAIETHDGRHIGFCELRDVHWTDRRAEVAVVLELESRGKGYGPDALRVLCRLAFDHLNLNRVYFIADAGNALAQKVGEKVGFKAEGRLESHTFLNGEFHDAVLMGLLAAPFRVKLKEMEESLEAAN